MSSESHPARRYDYWLGGTAHSEADRAAGDAIAAAYPAVRTLVLENRAFLRRAVRFLVSSGVTQFLDVGTGIPSPGNVGDLRQPSDILRRAPLDFTQPVGLLLISMLHFVQSPYEPVSVLVDGLALESPGLVPVSEWRNDGVAVPATEASAYAGVGRKPA